MKKLFLILVVLFSICFSVFSQENNENKFTVVEIQYIESDEGNVLPSTSQVFTSKKEVFFHYYKNKKSISKKMIYYVYSDSKKEKEIFTFRN